MSWLSSLSTVLTAAFLTCMQVSQETSKVIWWYSHLGKNFPQFVAIHTKGFIIVNEAEVDVFFWILLLTPRSNKCWQFDLWFFSFSKYSLFIWKFSIHILLKPGLKDFEQYLANRWNEHNCMIVWRFLAFSFFGIGMKTDLFQSCGHCWVFQICFHIESSSLTTSSFRILNSSAGIPSPLLALSAVMLP